MVLPGTRLISERFGAVDVERGRTPKDESDLDLDSNVHLPRLSQKTSSPDVSRTRRYS
jgi:hypothetical protein